MSGTAHPRGGVFRASVSPLPRVLRRAVVLAILAAGCGGRAPAGPAVVLPNTDLPEPSASGAPAAGVTLDLTRNVVWFVDAAGQTTHAPQDEHEIERLIPSHLTTRGSLEERYAGTAPEERVRRMREPTRVFLCTYENACFSIVQRLRGAPGDPAGFSAAERIKTEGDVLRHTLPAH